MEKDLFTDYNFLTLLYSITLHHSTEVYIGLNTQIYENINASLEAQKLHWKRATLGRSTHGKDMMVNLLNPNMKIVRLCNWRDFVTRCL